MRNYHRFWSKILKNLTYLNRKMNYIFGSLSVIRCFPSVLCCPSSALRSFSEVVSSVLLFPDNHYLIS